MSCTADRTTKSKRAEQAAAITSGTETSVSLLSDIRSWGVRGLFLLPGAADPIFAFMKPTKRDGGFKAHGRLVLLLLVLSIKPSGLFGKPTIKKV